MIEKDKLDGLSKHLRKKFMFGASHSREIIAAYFGYRSHAAFLSTLFTPKVIGDICFIDWRMKSLNGLGSHPVPEYLVSDISEYLKLNE